MPNHRIMKYSAKDGSFTVLRSPSNHANGNTPYRQGRLVTCGHSLTRRVTRTGKDGKITVLADSFAGKRLDAPSDIVVKSDVSLWFTDPTFGIKVFNPQGKAIGFIRLPERCPNLAFGGPKRNRLCMASSHSLDAMYVEAHGAV